MGNSGKTTDRSDSALAEHDRSEELVRRLGQLSKQAAKNKLPGATSDHSFLYTDQGTPN
jgi:hypothetical protein